MPTTIREAFEAASLRREGVVRWCEDLPTSASGVYLLSLSRSLNTYDGKLVTAPLAIAEFGNWLKACPRLTLDGVRPNAQDLMKRVAQFWHPDEVILYMGLAKSLSRRLGQYYRTPVGARRPHSGGFFLKLLSDLDHLWVHYALCPNPKLAEDRMLRRFCNNVSDESKDALFDPKHPFPFANLEWPRNVRKVHRLRGARN